MKDVRREQIKAMFKDFKKALRNGLWLNGFEGEGEFKSWYSNGQLDAHIFYKDGRFNGEYKSWYSNGQLASNVVYKDGKFIKSLN